MVYEVAPWGEAADWQMEERVIDCVEDRLLGTRYSALGEVRKEWLLRTLGLRLGFLWVVT